MNNSPSIKLQLEQEKLRKALLTLEEICDVEVDEARFYVDATIQRFEYSIELFWKYLKRILALHGKEVNLPRPILQDSFQNDFITNEKIWLDMLNDRNQTSHTYNHQLADEIYYRIKNIYVIEMRNVFDKLSNTNWKIYN